MCRRGSALARKRSTTPATITYTSNNPDTMIRFHGTSPFVSNGGPKAGVKFLVGLKKGPFDVQKVPAAGKHFHFDCGKKVGANFVPWGGGGDDFPGSKG